MTEQELGVLGAKFFDLQNQVLRTIKQAGYIRKKGKVRLPTVNNVGEYEDGVKFLEDFNANYAEPYEKLYSQHPPQTWTYFYMDSLSRTNTECLELTRLKKRMNERWAKRPAILRAAAKKKKPKKETPNENKIEEAAK